MRIHFAALMLAMSPLAQASDPPPWAYLVTPPGAAPPIDDGSPRQVPGSEVRLTLSRLRDLHDAPDWHPGDHPPMPAVVAHGRKPDLAACGYCHMPNGLGRPENASLAGLPAGYILQQLADFRSGSRKSSEPRMRPPAAMIGVAKAVTDDEARIAAEYFSSLKMQPWVEVVETGTVPRTRVSGMLVPLEDGSSEPIGRRIVEVPRDPARTALRDPRSGFIAYVPPGSLRLGEALVNTGGEGKTKPCATCHGPDLKGLGPVPGIAGRSPSYVVRQLYDFQQGSRAGLWSSLMRETVVGLTEDDMIAIAAYTASLAP